MLEYYVHNAVWADEGGGKEEIIRERGREEEGRKEGRKDAEILASYPSTST